MDFWKNNRLFLHLLLGAGLTVVYPMQQLFSGNQNIYFLWVMNELMPNTFTNDPILSSPDPYPLFTWFLTLLPLKLFPIWSTTLYFLLNSIYSFSFFGIANEISKIYSKPSKFLGFIVLFLVLHSSAIWGTYLQVLLDLDLRWIWDSGIAEQGVLRGYLQPSVFGVFLFLSFFQAIKKNYALAVLCVIPAALFHANYLLLGGVLTLIYILQSKFRKETILASILAAIVVSPYVVYLTQYFVFIDEGLKLAIIETVQAGFDTNIHLNPKNWLNQKLYIQITAVLTAIILSLQRRWFGLFVKVLAATIGITLIAFLLNNSVLISLNPWRMSIVLVPFSVAILSGSLFGINSRASKLGFIAITVTICTGFLTHRLLGNDTDAFRTYWLIGQATLLTCLIGGGFIVQKWMKKEILNAGLTVSLCILISVGFIQSLIEEKFKSKTEQFQVINALKNDNSEAVYLIPPSWTSFRLNAQKAVFVDNNLVYGPALPALTKRLNLIETAHNALNYDAVLTEIPENVSVRLVTDLPSGRKLNKPHLSLTKNYVLVELRK